jgi:hypothetical protein
MFATPIFRANKFSDSLFTIRERISVRNPSDLKGNFLKRKSATAAPSIASPRYSSLSFDSLKPEAALSFAMEL